MPGELHVERDNTKEREAALGQDIASGLEQVGLAAEGHAKAKCPVDTGRLRNSITHAQADPRTEVVGTNVEYGEYVELDTSRTAAQP